MTHNSQHQRSNIVFTSEYSLNSGVTPNPRSSKVRDVLRQLRLQILASLPRPPSSWKLPTERRKVAIYQSRRVAILYSLLHLLPLAGAMTLLVLYWTRYWIGPEFQATVILQFLAKLLELLMQASIMEMSLCVIRAIAVNHYVPLGALSGATQTTQLSYLWSLDLWSSFRAPGFHAPSQILFFSFFPFSLLMAALVGPSAAILMIPRPKTPFKNATAVLYGLDSADVMFPSNVTETTQPKLDNTPENNRVELYFDLVNNGYLRQDIFDQTKLPENDQLDADQDVHYDSIIYRTSYSNNDASLRELAFAMKSRSEAFEKNSYFATLPTQFSAIALHQFSGYNISNFAGSQKVSNFSDPVWSVAMPQPVVQADCLSMPSTSASDSSVPFVRDDGSTGSLFTLAELLSRIRANGGLKKPVDSQLSSLKHYYPPVWLTSPEIGSSSLVGIFAEAFMAAYPGSNFSMVDIYNETATDFIKDASLSVELCTFRSHWESAVISFDSQLLVLKSNLSQHFVDSFRENLQPIALHLAPDSILRTAEFIGNLDSYIGPVNICALLAVGLAGMPPWVSETKDKNFQTPFRFTQTLTGYSYGHSTNSDLLSAIIITAYCIATIAYITYTIFTGSVSTAWDSPIELVIFALQSRSVDHLGHTSVGIDSMHTFRENAGIRVNEKNALEIVFAHSRVIEIKGLRKIERNKEYRIFCGEKDPE